MLVNPDSAHEAEKGSPSKGCLQFVKKVLAGLFDKLQPPSILL